MDIKDLEQDLLKSDLIKEKCKNQKYAQSLYAALCNIMWYTDETVDKPWSCSWRYAGGIVSDITTDSEGGGDYLDWYCSGIGGKSTPEGKVEKEIEDDLLSLGWKWRHYTDDDYAEFKPVKKDSVVDGED